MNIVLYMFLFVTGFVLGFIAACLGVLRLKAGVLQIDRSDPDDAPYPFLRSDMPIEELSRRKVILLDVKNENFVSQK